MNALFFIQKSKTDMQKFLMFLSSHFNIIVKLVMGKPLLI